MTNNLIAVILYTLVQNVEQLRKTVEKYLFSVFYIYFLCAVRNTYSFEA